MLKWYYLFLCTTSKYVPLWVAIRTFCFRHFGSDRNATGKPAGCKQFYIQAQRRRCDSRVDSSGAQEEGSVWFLFLRLVVRYFLRSSSPFIFPISAHPEELPNLGKPCYKVTDDWRRQTGGNTHMKACYFCLRSTKFHTWFDSDDHAWRRN